MSPFIAIAIIASVVAVVILISRRKPGGSGTGGRPNGDGPTDQH